MYARRETQPPVTKHPTTTNKNNTILKTKLTNSGKKPRIEKTTPPKTKTNHKKKTSTTATATATTTTIPGRNLRPPDVFWKQNSVLAKRPGKSKNELRRLPS
jgi:hypothetical protein